MKQTLDELIESGKKKKNTPTNGYVREQGFSHLYIRYWPRHRFINGKPTNNVLDIANVASRKPGSGAFTKLIKRLRSEYPDMTLFVENVQTSRFRNKLESLGFSKANQVDFIDICSYVLYSGKGINNVRSQS